GEVYPLMQAKSLAQMGHEVDVVVLKTEIEYEYFETYTKDNPVNIVYLHSPLQQKEKFDQNVFDHIAAHKLYFSLSRELGKLCIEKRYDWAVTHYGPAVIGVPKSIKQLFILHGVPSQRQEINYAAIHLADTVVSDSNSIAEEWKRMFDYEGKI